jgi:hypothetical protein
MNQTDESTKLGEALAITAEVMGTYLSEDACTMMLYDLSAWPVPAVMQALHRVRQECKGRLTIADIIARIDDGRPTEFEAWGMIPRDELETAVMTDEMSTAMQAAMPLMGTDEYAARRAFTEAYNRLVSQARANRQPTRWFASLGHDPVQRERVITQAVEQGRLSQQQAIKLLPGSTVQPTGPMLEIAHKALKQLAAS